MIQNVYGMGEELFNFLCLFKNIFEVVLYYQRLQYNFFGKDLDADSCLMHHSTTLCYVLVTALYIHSTISCLFLCTVYIGNSMSRLDNVV